LFFVYAFDRVALPLNPEERIYGASELKKSRRTPQSLYWRRLPGRRSTRQRLRSGAITNLLRLYIEARIFAFCLGMNETYRLRTTRRRDKDLDISPRSVANTSSKRPS